MEKLRAETLEEILKKGRAYPHELRAIIPELQLLRDVHDGKRKMPEADFFIIEVPRLILEGDTPISPGDAMTILGVGGTALVRTSISPSRRYILHRVK